MGKIKTIEELKKALEELRNTFHGQEAFSFGHGKCWGLNEALEKINEFEAELWKLHDLGLADTKTLKLIINGETELKKVLSE